MTVAERNIQFIRDQMNLSTKQLAALIGVSERAVARWIEGTREVPEPVWQLLDLIVAEWINQEINKELVKLIHQHDGKRSYVDAGGRIVFTDKTKG